MEDILGTVTKDESARGDDLKNNKKTQEANNFQRFGNLFKFGADDDKDKKW